METCQVTLVLYFWFPFQHGLQMLCLSEALALFHLIKFTDKASLCLVCILFLAIRNLLPKSSTFQTAHITEATVDDSLVEL